MIFWLAVLIGALFAWIGVQIGFYGMWIMFFNLVLSAYVALFLTPVIVSALPAAVETTFGYGYGLVLVVIAIATLLIAYGMCYACLSGQLRAEFPKAFDNIGAGILGFLTGFLVCSFVAFAVALTPVTQIDSLKPLGLDAPSQKTNTSYLCWCSNKLHSLVASSSTTLTTSQHAVNYLLAKAGVPAGGGPRRGAPPQPAGAGAAPERGPRRPPVPEGEEPAATGRPEGVGEQEAETGGPRAGRTGPATRPVAPARPPRRDNEATEEEPPRPPRGQKPPPPAKPDRVVDPFAPTP
jgi:hypothetical protein